MGRDRSRAHAWVINCLLFSIIILPVFMVSCISKEVPVTETYYETEYRTEYRIENYEDIMELNFISKFWKDYFFEIQGAGIASMYYYHYKIETNEPTKDQVRIAVSPLATGYLGVWNNTNLEEGFVFNMVWNDETYHERILIFEPMKDFRGLYITFDAIGINDFYILANSFNSNCISRVDLVSYKERQVPYQVPYQVEKQRTVMKTQKAPFWEAIFNKNVTPAPKLPEAQPTTPAPEIPIIKTYTAPDYSYSFNYPGDWVDQTSDAPFEFISDCRASGWLVDIFLGFNEDGYDMSGIICLHKIYPQPLTLEEIEKFQSSADIETNRMTINGKDALEVLRADGDPSRLETMKTFYIPSGNTLFMFVVGGSGKSWCDSFDFAYSTFINSLQVR